MNLDQSFSILFWLHKTKINSDGMAPIYIRITIDGKRARMFNVKNDKAQKDGTPKRTAKSRLLLSEADIGLHKAD